MMQNGEGSRRGRSQVAPTKDAVDPVVAAMAAAIRKGLVYPETVDHLGLQHDDYATRLARAAHAAAKNPHPEITAMAALSNEAASLFTDITQILDVVSREWAAEGQWSPWDQSVRDHISDWLRAYYPGADRAAAVKAALAVATAHTEDTVRKARVIAKGMAPLEGVHDDTQSRSQDAKENPLPNPSLTKGAG